MQIYAINTNKQAAKNLKTICHSKVTLASFSCLCVCVLACVSRKTENKTKAKIKA